MVAERGLIRRLGLVGGGHHARLVWSILAVGLALYALGYSTFYPRAITVDDEGHYLEQVRSWVEAGSFQLAKIDPLSGEQRPLAGGYQYPFGMVALMAPFVDAFGWRGAFVPSFLCLLISVLATARWLHDERRSPLFALVLLAFPALLVAGRLAMSDSARTAAAALGLWLFFRGLDRGARGAWLASGFVAGASLSLRETAVLPFVPFFAGSVLRRDRGWAWLLLGGLAGSALHFVTNQMVHGDAFFVRGPEALYPFDLTTLHERLPIYLLGLLVLVPGGLAFGLAYRGRRRPEVVATLVFFFLFYLFQAYGMSASSFPKRLVLALRYFDPLLPLLAFAMAESLPRTLSAFLARLPNRPRAEALVGAAASLWIAGTLAATLVVHPALDRWSASQVEIREAIERHVPADVVLVANGVAIQKFIDDVSRPYLTLFRDDVSDGDLARLREQHGGFVVAFLDRSDSAYWRDDAALNAAFVARIGAPEPVLDLRATATDRLRIWRVGEPAARATAAP